MDNRLLVIIG